jgi:hypothetical protein
MRRLNDRQNKMMQIKSRARAIALQLKAKKPLKTHPKTPSRYPSM